MFKLALALGVSGVAGEAITGTAATLDDLLSSGKNSIVKYLAPWWGHCKSMKPAYDQLGAKYADSSSVQIIDVDCTVHQDACSARGVQGYPTIKYYTDGDTEGKDYQSGRDYDSMEKFVKDTLEKPCLVSSGEGCVEKEKTYIDKFKAKGKDKVGSELERLTKMSSGSMKADKKQWLSQRMHILKGLSDEL